MKDYVRFVHLSSFIPHLAIYGPKPLFSSNSPAESNPFKLPIQVVAGENERRRPAVRAMMFILGEVTLGKKRFDFLVGQPVAEFHRCLTGDHMQQVIKQIACIGPAATLQQFIDQIAQHLGRTQVGQHGRIARNKYRLAAERLHFDAQLCQELRMLQCCCRFASRQIHRLRHQQLLRFEHAAQHLFSKLFVQNALVKRVLIDDFYSNIRFDDKIPIVNLERILR
jgi:hypothetical protein